MNATTARTRTAREATGQATLHGDTAWQVTAVIPDLGNLVHALRTPVLSHALVHGAPTLLACWLLLPIWIPLRTEDRS